MAFLCAVDKLAKKKRIIIIIFFPIENSSFVTMLNCIKAVA